MTSEPDFFAEVERAQHRTDALQRDPRFRRWQRSADRLSDTLFRVGAAASVLLNVGVAVLMFALDETLLGWAWLGSALVCGPVIAAYLFGKLAHRSGGAMLFQGAAAISMALVAAAPPFLLLAFTFSFW